MKNILSDYLSTHNYEFKAVADDLIFFNVKNGDVFKINNSLLDSFINSVVNKKTKETKTDKLIKECFEKPHPKIEPKNKIPFHIQWHINENCNLRCKHCYQDSYTHQGLSLEEMKKIVDKYFVAINKWGNLPEFSLTGGEPLLNPHLFELIKYIKSKDKNTRIAILTNGTLLDREKTDKLKELGINQIQISLEGSTEKINDDIRGSGTYNKIISAVDLLKQAKIKTSLHFVISKKNNHDVQNYINLAKKLKINMLTFSNLVPFGNGENMKDLLLSPAELKKTYELIAKEAEVLDKKEELPNIRRTRPIWCNFKCVNENRPVGGLCPVGISTLTILSTGEVMPCRRFPVVIGDLKKQNFFEIWYKSDVLWNVRNRENIDGCGKCKHKDNCGGCRGLAYVYFNNYMAPDPQCWLINDELGDYYAKK